MSVHLVRDYAGRWGVPVVVLHDHSEVLHRAMAKGGPGYWRLWDWATAPYIMINENDVAPLCLDDRWSGWPFLLHELAHVAAPVMPEAADEDFDTLGFELLSIRFLGLSLREWAAWQQKTRGRIRANDGTFGEYASWRASPRAWRRETVARAIARSLEAGLFDAATQPTFRIARLQHDDAAKAKVGAS